MEDASSRKGEILSKEEHMLRRPDMYIGNRKSYRASTWIFDEKSKSIVFRPITINDGVVRLFVEASSNAIDNKFRSEKYGVKMTTIAYTIPTLDDEVKTFSVMNDGYFISAKKQTYRFRNASGEKVKEELYPAEVFWGRERAGTNFKDDATRKTSGRNGVGAKAIVVYSTEATIEHTDPDEKMQFTQTYSNNGKKRGKPILRKWHKKSPYTKVTFTPDYEYFDYEYNAETFALLKRYVYEAAMITGLKITLNGEKVTVKNLVNYSKLFYSSTSTNLVNFTAPNGDECVIIEKLPETETADTVSNISWVNGIHTREGGVHVDAWVSVIIPAIVKCFNARKGGKGKASGKELMPYFVLFIRSELAGASFDSQTKDRLVGPDVVLTLDAQSKKSFNATIKDTITKKMLKWEFVSLLEEKLLAKAERAISKKEGTTRKRMNYGNKLEEANKAGTKEAKRCVLIITEGQSAKGFADEMIKKMNGSTNYYGSFAVKGKGLNVSGKSLQTIANNKEIEMLKKIIGLRMGAVYDEEYEGLRYGCVMFLTDADPDGLHIRGLLLNFFYTMWPSLFELVNEDGLRFFKSLSTAITIVRFSTKKGKKEELQFYTNQEYQRWIKDVSTTKPKNASTKYYKGLGSYQAGEAILYSGDDRKEVGYTIGEDVAETAEAMKLGFDGKSADARKEWIVNNLEVVKERPITVEGDLPVSQFVNQDMLVYHAMTLSRALPSFLDGFKESHRKILYGIIQNKKAKKNSLKLAQLSSSVIEHSAYHHGEASMYATMIGMAQDFVGSNNIPLMEADGIFGSRATGEDNHGAAAPRYIFSKLCDIVSIIFRNEDLPLLEQLYDDGEPIEYAHFMPIIPMLLVNGCEGIATGYSCNIPCYNPRDLVDFIKKWLDVFESDPENVDENERLIVNFPPLTPWYQGFIGTITLTVRNLSKSSKTVYDTWDPNSDIYPDSWTSEGILESTKKGWYSIQELPIGMWNDKMKEYLDELSSGVPATEKKAAVPKKIVEYQWNPPKYGQNVRWDFKPAGGFEPDINDPNSFGCLRAAKTLTNMHVLNEKGYPKKYDRAEDIVNDFCVKRYDFYVLRKAYVLKQLKKKLIREEAKHLFVTSIINGDLVLNKEDDEILDSLTSLKLPRLKDDANEIEKEEEENEEKDEEKVEEETGLKGYEYLLKMHMRSMTVRKVQEFEATIAKIREEITKLKNTTEGDLWRNELDEFLVAYEKFVEKRWPVK